MATTTAPPPGVDPSPRAAVRVGRVIAGFAVTYRRTWRGSVVSSFLTPVLFLLAMGVGLGDLVDQHQSGGLQGLSYLSFVGTGLLAATSMQMAAVESTWPVMAGIKWRKGYHAMLASPIDVRDIVHGHLGWCAIRLMVTSTIFLVVLTAFGVVDSPWGILAVPAATLTGLAFAAPISAFAATRENDRAFASLMRFGILPMFLFSGTFFPIDQLPSALQTLAMVTPLWHGVELCRSLCLGDAGFVTSLGHVLYLVMWTAAGTIVAHWTFERRLVV
jgi:lipooligosaccharide transport system permease protein